MIELDTRDVTDPNVSILFPAQCHGCDEWVEEDTLTQVRGEQSGFYCEVCVEEMGVGEA